VAVLPTSLDYTDKDFGLFGESRAAWFRRDDV